MRRFRFQFRLRTLLLAVVVLSVPCSWLGCELRRAKRQAAAVAFIESGGGWVFYSFQKLPRSRWAYEPASKFDYILEGGEPRRVHVDSHFLVFVDEVHLAGPQHPRTALPYLEDLRSLRRLTVVGGDVARDDLRQLRQLACLEWLGLPQSKVADDGLRGLGALRGLKWLDLSDTDVSDEGLQHIGALAELRYLDLSRTQVTDESVPILKGLASLNRLLLSGTRISESGVNDLRFALSKTWIENSSAQQNQNEGTDP